MKLLLESWKAFLTEISSDDLYYRISDFIISFFSEYKNVVGKKSKVDSTPDINPSDTTSNIIFCFQAKPEIINDDLYKRYLDFTEDEKILLDFEKFSSYLNQIKMYVLWQYVDEEGNDYGGTMDDNGVLKISSIILDISDQEDFEELKPKEILSIINNNNKVKTVLDHEVAHFINAIRANGEGFRSKGGMKQFETGTQEYIDSTEEIQARIIQVIKKITNSSPLYKSSYFPKIKLQEFIDMFTKYYDAGHGYWKESSPQTKKRIIKRISDTEDGIFITMKNRWKKENSQNEAST